jgi:hypothetical protein
VSDDNYNEKLKAIDSKLNLLVSWMTGNEKPHMGLIVRVDRLEQQNKRQAFWMGIIGTAAAGGIALEVLKRIGFIGGGHL